MPHFLLPSAIAWLRTVRARFSRARHSSAGARATIDRYRAALAALPADTRRIFLLHRAEDLDIVTIAERTGLSTAEIEQHLADAILAISGAIDDVSG